MFFAFIAISKKVISENTSESTNFEGEWGANRSLGKYNVLLLFSVNKPGLYHLAKVYAVEKDEDDILVLTCTVV